MKNQEIANALDELVDDISKHIHSRCDDEVRNWLMTATMQIWAANKLFSSDYSPVLHAFIDRNFTTAQIMTALDCFANENRELSIPSFFCELVKKDLELGTCISRNTADAIGRFLVMPALANGDFTMEEARALDGIHDMLLAYCDEYGVATGKPQEHHPEMITALKKESYHQKEEHMRPSDGSSNKPETSTPPSPAPQPEESMPTITVNLNISTDQVGEHLLQGQPEDVPTTNISVQKPAQNDEENRETLESVLAELHGLVGLDQVKQDVQSLLNFIQICRLRTQRGMKVPTISYHLVFTGNPGTGKTTVARLVAKLYYLMGILPQGQLVETDRSGLVAGYLGQTAIKTQKVIQQALGGVLFIDEAYALANDEDDSYGKEAIETILKAMEDHRDELVVIVAGYDELMHKFIDSNPGLRSRFNKHFHFPDYCGEDLLKILQRFCSTNGYSLAENAIPLLRQTLNDTYANREEHFGNARAVRNLFEHAIHRQADRLVKDPDITDRELAELTLDDILPAMEVL